MIHDKSLLPFIVESIQIYGVHCVGAMCPNFFYMTEKEFSSKVIARLQKHFYCYEEQLGIHPDGRKKRIDYIVKPKDNSLWFRKDIAFGIEFKRPDIYSDTTNVTSLIKQAYDYSYVRWDIGCKEIPILICPFNIHNSLCNNDEMVFVNKLLSKLNIGKIVNDKYKGLVFMFSHNYHIWSERDGVTGGKHCNFIIHK